MKNKFTIFSFLFCIMIIQGCKEPEKEPIVVVELATIGTSPVVAITGTDALSGGNVTSDGGGAVTAKGVCWNTTANPVVTNDHTTDATGIGSYTSSITGLSGGTSYHVRAYATNSAGTAYGNDVTFTTLTLPTLTTLNISGTTGYSADGGGSISSEGSSPVTARGICWSTSPGPTIANAKTSNGTGTGLFYSSMTGLSPSVTYFVRAYATNTAGTAYGNEISFATAFVCGESMVKDIDGNTYHTVEIGSQCWLKENLRVTQYTTGGNFANVTDNTAWCGLSTAAWCDVNNDPANKELYGRLYNGWAAVGGIAPAGWHVATDAEFTTLVNYLGGPTVAGGHMKATTTWNTPNAGADNNSGFTGLGTGDRYCPGTGTFDWINSWTLFWTTTASTTPGELWGYRLGYNGAGCEQYSNPKTLGFPIRCVKD